MIQHNGEKKYKMMRQEELRIGDFEHEYASDIRKMGMKIKGFWKKGKQMMDT